MARSHSMHGNDNTYMKSWSENPKGRDHSEDLGVDGRISEWMLQK
jgi:hypothetical protein